MQTVLPGCKDSIWNGPPSPPPPLGVDGSERRDEVLMVTLGGGVTDWRTTETSIERVVNKMMPLSCTLEMVWSKSGPKHLADIIMDDNVLVYYTITISIEANRLPNETSLILSNVTNITQHSIPIWWLFVYTLFWVFCIVVNVLTVIGWCMLRTGGGGCFALWFMYSQLLAGVCWGLGVEEGRLLLLPLLQYKQQH